MATNWRAVRQQVLDRDRYECQFQLVGCTHNAIDVHRNRVLAGEGVADADTCTSACPTCLRQLRAKRVSAGKFGRQ